MFKGQGIGWFACTVCHTLFKPTVLGTAFHHHHHHVPEGLGVFPVP